MSALSSNSFDKISGNVKELSKKGNLKVKKHIIKEVEIWCKNTGIAQQFLDAICFLGSLNQYSKKKIHNWVK